MRYSHSNNNNIQSLFICKKWNWSFYCYCYLWIYFSCVCYNKKKEKKGYIGKVLSDLYSIICRFNHSLVATKNSCRILWNRKLYIRCSKDLVEYKKKTKNLCHTHTQNLCYKNAWVYCLICEWCKNRCLFFGHLNSNV